MSLVDLIDRLDESIGRGDNIATLRNQLATIREQVEALETKLRDVEVGLEAANLNRQGLEAKLQNLHLHSEQEQIEDGAKQILKLAFDSGGNLYLDRAAAQLDMKKSVAEYHLDYLQNAGLMEGPVAYGPMSGALYVLTAKGRAYVVKNKLA
jgi:chromosome segregation ATPase